MPSKAKLRPAVLIGIPFSYQANLSSLAEPEITSRSPSLSTSATNSPQAPSAELLSIISVKVGLEAPSFLYKETLSLAEEVDMISMFPSASISAAYTARAPFAVVLTTCSVKFSDPSFSYQAILLSLWEADIKSMSPSPSKSAANTVCAKLAFVLTTRSVKF